MATEGRILGMDAQQLWRRTTLWLVPMVNPDGVDLVTGAIRPGSQQYQAAQRIAAGFPEIPFPGGWKANLTGTDLNLNYPAGWEQARTNKFALGFTGPAPRDYVGASPLDQPETAAFSAGFASNIRSFSGTTVPRAVLAETAVTVNCALPEWTSCRASTLPLPG